MAGGSAAVAFGCATRVGGAPLLSSGPGANDPTPPVEPALVPRPAQTAGRSERGMLASTKWQTPAVIAHSGVEGPSVMVLGGVHGDEPGAQRAAEIVAGWWPLTGSLLVIPRTNTLAIAAGKRTLTELVDLNRLYPGDPKGTPMARMAASIIDLAREFNVQVLYDMHESWSFYTGRAANGNAYLGQTVSSGLGPETASIAKALAARVNSKITIPRDRMSARLEVPAENAKATNSLGIGRYVPDLTAVLVEMGQERQEVSRRVELHLLVLRTFLESRGML